MLEGVRSVSAEISHRHSNLAVREAAPTKRTPSRFLAKIWAPTERMPSIVLAAILNYFVYKMLIYDSRLESEVTR